MAKSSKTVFFLIARCNLVILCLQGIVVVMGYGDEVLLVFRDNLMSFVTIEEASERDFSALVAFEMEQNLLVLGAFFKLALV
jgi:hypothetical protein